MYPRFPLFRRGPTIGAVAILVAVLIRPVSISAAANDLPSFNAIKARVEKMLARDPNYRPRDLLSRGQVASVLRELKSAGWDVPQSGELLKRVPGDEEFLVRALRTARGVSFMRRIAAMPDGYDRLDRLSRLPGGQATVRQLIDGPDGHKLVGYLTESSGGKELGKMLARTMEGEDFNRATGRIYTADALLVELQELHQETRKQLGQ